MNSTEQNEMRIIALLRPEERALFDQPWSVTESALRYIEDVLALIDRLPVDARLDFPAFKAAAAQRAQKSQPRGVAVIPVTGVITPKDGVLSYLGFGTSIEALRAQHRQAMADPSVAAVVLQMDSPGGSVLGVDEMAQEIYDSRSIKPTVAVADGLMASAAYWLGSAASEIVATPSADVGSIGVMQVHQDISASEERRGVKSTIISAGKYKTELNPLEPLSADGKAYLQQRVNEYYDSFTNRVAENRGTNQANVIANYGEGRTFGAKAAVDAGMVDWIGSVDQAITRTARKVGIDVRPGAAAGVDHPQWGEGPDVDVLRRRLALLLR